MLFAVQFFSSITLSAEVDRSIVLVLSAIYIALALAQFVRRRRELGRTTRDGLITPFGQLEADRAAASR